MTQARHPRPPLTGPSDRSIGTILWQDIAQIRTLWQIAFQVLAALFLPWLAL